MGQTKKGVFKKMLFLWIGVLSVYALLSVLALVLINKKISIDSKNQWNWGWTILSIEFLHFSLSFRTVGPKSLGAVLLFGRPLYQVKSGLVYVPFMICQLAKETKLVIKEQFPAEPELVDKSGDDTKLIKDGFVKPIRVTTASKDMISSTDKERIKDFLNHPLNEIMTLEPSVVVRFQIRNDDFISFLTNIGSIEHAVSQMRDTVDSVLNIEFPKRTPSLIILDKEEINSKLKEKIEILVGEKDTDSKESWGINVLNVQIADLDLSKTINESLRDVADSQLKKTASIIKAEGDKKSRELAGEAEKKFETDKGAGVANARLSFLEAESKGFEKIAKVAETEEGKLAVIAKATEQGLKGSQYSIVPDGAGSIIAGIMEVMKKTGSRETPKKVEEDLKSNKGDKK